MTGEPQYRYYLGMGEPQYSHYKNLPRQQLRLMSGQLWLEDPKMLGIHLARYKFVAKMLAGKGRVAEIGCGDGFYSRLVEKEVIDLSLYDLDNSMSANIHHLDITKRRLTEETKFNAIYSLDCFEHISPEHIDAALKNVCVSLVPDGIFICGMPSLESQVYASEVSKIGHVNCMNGEQMRLLMHGYFKNIFMFGMSDEVVHTGFLPMSHYLIALCVGVK